MQQVEHDGGARIRLLYCAGAATQSGNAARVLCSARRATAVVRPVFGNDQWLRLGQGRTLAAQHGWWPHRLGQQCATHLAQAGRIMVDDDRIGRLGSTQRLPRMACFLAARLLLPEGSCRLLTRTGFFSPSLDGGLPLLLLFKPLRDRRSNSAMRACIAAISAAWRASCANNRAMRSCGDRCSRVAGSTDLASEIGPPKLCCQTIPSAAPVSRTPNSDPSTLSGRLSGVADYLGSYHKSLDTLRGYVRRVDLFKEHAGAAFL